MEAFKNNFKSLIETVVANNDIHAKWLNTLSMMENTGARKISKFEHPVLTDIVILKHAAEEARHAYYLKKQISKLAAESPDYSFPYLLSPMESYHYLHSLDVLVSRYLKTERKMEGREMMFGAYLLVTYAIEVRADMLYGIYQDVLANAGSKVNVKSIIAEEEGHLAEMNRMLKEFSTDWEVMAKDVLEIEDKLFVTWVKALQNELSVTAA